MEPFRPTAPKQVSVQGMPTFDMGETLEKLREKSGGDAGGEHSPILCIEPMFPTTSLNRFVRLVALFARCVTTIENISDYANFFFKCPPACWPARGLEAGLVMSIHQKGRAWRALRCVDLCRGPILRPGTSAVRRCANEMHAYSFGQATSSTNPRNLIVFFLEYFKYQ